MSPLGIPAARWLATATGDPLHRSPTPFVRNPSRSSPLQADRVTHFARNLPRLLFGTRNAFAVEHFANTAERCIGRAPGQLRIL